MDNRNRNDRDRRRTESYRSSADPYGSKQAEQFEDNSAYSQDDGWSDSYDRQRADRGRPIGMYYEEYVVRGPRRERDERDAAEAYAARRDRAGSATPAAGYGYFTSESQGGRDFTGFSQRGGYGAGAPARATRRYEGGESDFVTSRHSDTPRERDWWDKTTDEVASWFGDDDAARRRKMDHRGRGPSDYTRSDDRIREDVNDNLTEDRAVDARKVSVKVANGEVTLEGTVPTRLQKRRAEDCAEEVSGVKHVQNNLRVQETAGRSSDHDTTARSTTTS